MMRGLVIFIVGGCFHSPLLAQEGKILAGSREGARLLTDARQHQQAKQHSLALQQYRDFLQRYPSDPALGLAYQGLGTCQLDLGQLDAAIPSLQQALKHLSPGNDDTARWNLAIALGKRGEQEKTPLDIVQAAEHFEKFTKLSRGSVEKRSRAYQLWGEMLVAQARLSEKNNQWQEAGQQFRAFLQNFPDHPQVENVQIALLEVYLRLGNNDQYQRWLLHLETKGNLQIQETALFRTGELLANEKKYAEAAEQWGMLLHRYPLSKLRDQAERQRAVALSQLPERHREALTLMRTWIEQHPHDPLAVGTLARATVLAMKVGDFEESLELAHELRLKTKDRATQLAATEWAALSALHQQNWQEAFELYQEVLKNEPERSKKHDMQLTLARCLNGMHRYPEANKIYTDLLKNPLLLGSETDRVLAEAVACGSRGKNTFDAQEVAWLKQLHEKFPNSPWTAEAYLQASHQAAKKGDFAKALEWAKKCLATQSRPHQSHGLFLAGYCSFKLNHPHDAATLFQLLVRHHQQYEKLAEARYMFATALQSSHRQEDAQVAFAEFYHFHPQHELAMKARELANQIPR